MQAKHVPFRGDGGFRLKIICWFALASANVFYRSGALSHSQGVKV